MHFKINKIFYRLTPQTLLFRFLLIIIIPILISQILTIYLFYDRHWYNVSSYTGTIISKEIKVLLDSFKKNDLKTQALIKDFLSLSFTFKPNHFLLPTKKYTNAEIEILHNILNEKIAEKNIIEVSENKINIAFQLENGLFLVNIPAKLLINPSTYIFILWFIFLTILLLSVSLIFSKNQIRSILELAKAADAFGRGINADFYYKPTGAKEIRHAGYAFLKMKARIEKQLLKRTQMLAMISHDLRTPLTRMKLQLALMDSTQNTQDLQNDIESMNQMIASYLDFARGEGGEDFQAVDITSWLRQYLTSKHQEQYVELETPDSEIKVNIKIFAFERAIVNLLNNAFKYGTRAKIIIQSTKHKVLINVEDNGEGIAEEDRINVFKPFYRSDQARSLYATGSATGNVGLGLAITKEIILDHHGSIELSESSSLGGLAVQIILPIL